MTGGQYLGFYFYPASVSPAELRLGSIVWNYKQPVHKHSYQHEDNIGMKRELFDCRDYNPFDVNLTDPKTFTAGIGIENVAWFRGHYGNKVVTHIKSEKAKSVHVLSTKLDDFETLVCKDEKARDWLHKNLSAAFTAGSICQRFLRRPKLWLCTGLMTIEKGGYEVTYEGGKGVDLTLSDPTGSIPDGAQLGVDSSPTSSRTFGITQSTVVAAQWMLLYCRNVKSTEDPTSANYVRLTATYAKNNVKDAEAPLVWISTDAKEIKEEELKGRDLFVASADDELDFSDEEDEGSADESMMELFEPMFPEAGTEEYEKFERTLEKLS